MAEHDEGGRTVKSVGKVFAIVKLLDERDGARVTDIANDLEISKASAHHHLTTLLDEEFVVRDGDEYRLGLKFYDYGMRVKNEVPLCGATASSLEQLAEQTGEMAWLLVEEHGWAVSVEKAVGQNAVQTLGRLGKRMYLHYHAGGKAILANLPRERRREIVERHGLPQLTEDTITDVDELERHLETVRERGYALHDSEAVVGARAVGAPIMIEGEVEGSVAITGPENHMPDERFTEELPGLVMGTANEIGLRFAYSN